MKNRIFCLAVLAIACVVAGSCSNNKTEPEGITFTTRVSLSSPGPFKALDAEGHKTFKAGDRIAIVYENIRGELVKTRSQATYDSGASATFGYSLIDAKANGILKIIYPDGMAKDDGSVNYDALASQNGTLLSLGNNLDLAMYEGTLSGTQVPASVPLTNRLAICAFTLKNSDGTSEITDNITGLYIKAGSDIYNISRTAAAGPIYVAMRPVSGVDVLFTAVADGAYYVKSLTGKTYEANNLYPLGLRMGLRPQAQFTVSSGKTVYFSPGNLQYDSGSWQFAVNQWDVLGNEQGPDHRDLFGWGTGDDPNKVVVDYSQYTAFVDWGSNTIVNGGTGWRTLTKDEWMYLFNYRSGPMFAKATVNGRDGVILLPDSWNDNYVLLGVDEPYSEYDVNVISSADWTDELEANGAVFLPAAGIRGTSLSEDFSAYWSVDPVGSSQQYAYCLYFYGYGLSAGYDQLNRSTGAAVRLVKDVQ